MSEAQAYVGIDVSKAELEVAVGEEGWTVSNDESGIETLLEQLRERPIELVVLEATGGHETPAAAVLAEAGLPVVVANPRQVRDFARARTARGASIARRGHPGVKGPSGSSSSIARDDGCREEPAEDGVHRGGEGHP